MFWAQHGTSSYNSYCHTSQSAIVEITPIPYMWRKGEGRGKSGFPELSPWSLKWQPETSLWETAQSSPGGSDSLTAQYLNCLTVRNGLSLWSTGVARVLLPLLLCPLCDLGKSPSFDYNNKALCAYLQACVRTLRDNAWNYNIMNYRMLNKFKGASLLWPSYLAEPLPSIVG